MTAPVRIFRFLHGATDRGGQGPAGESSQILVNIQVLRAFAAINVVLFHIIDTSFRYGMDVRLFAPLEGWGANGVDVFFVISGFVMFHTQYLRKSTPLAFMRNRVIRIVPLYWLLTLLFLAIYLVQPSIFRTVVVDGAAVVSSFLFASKVVLDSNPLVYVGWTLEWEMIFYVIFAACLLFRSWLATIVITALGLVAASAITGNPIVLEFLFGMICAYVYHHARLGEGTGLALFASGVAGLLLSIGFQFKDMEVERVWIWGLPSFLIILGAVHARQMRGRLLAWLGDASYSIYLVQVFTIPAFYKVAERLLRGVHGDMVAVACLAASVAAGCVLYAVVERPVTDVLRRRNRGPKPLPAAAI